MIITLITEIIILGIFIHNSNSRAYNITEAIQQ